MDFALVEDTLYVLDPVNARVQLFDLAGRVPPREIAIGTRTAEFLGVDADGNVTVLDAFVRREFATFSGTGERIARAELPASIQLASAIWAGGDRVWIEDRHDRVYEIHVARDKPEALARIVGSMAGRPMTQAQRAVHAAKNGARRVVVRTNARDEPRSSPQSGEGEAITLEFPCQVHSVVALESDDAGRIYLAVACVRDQRSDPWKADIVLVTIAPDGQIAGSIRMPNAYVTDHYRKLLVSHRGDIIQMQTAEEGVRFVRWTMPIQTEEGVER
jgi:hypothetical protein